MFLLCSTLFGCFSTIHFFRAWNLFFKERRYNVVVTVSKNFSQSPSLIKFITRNFHNSKTHRKRILFANFERNFHIFQKSPETNSFRQFWKKFLYFPKITGNEFFSPILKEISIFSKNHRKRILFANFERNFHIFQKSPDINSFSQILKEISIFSKISSSSVSQQHEKKGLRRQKWKLNFLHFKKQFWANWRFFSFQNLEFGQKKSLPKGFRCDKQCYWTASKRFST